MHEAGESPFGEAGGLMAEGRTIWERSGLPPMRSGELTLISDAVLSAYKGKNAESLAAACQCFWLFRKLHRLAGDHPVCATLLGDYYFSLFSKHLIPLDSAPLIDEFARLLIEDTQRPVNQADYIGFVKRLPKALTS